MVFTLVAALVVSTFTAAQAAAPGARIAVTSTATAAGSPTAALVASDSGWTTSRSPDRPQRINGLSVTASQDRTYLKFDGQSLGGQTVTSATLVLHVRSTTATQPGVVVYPTSADWSSSSLTRSNQPDRTGPAASEASSAPRPGEALRIPVDVDAISTEGSFGLRLEFVQKYIRLLLERNGADAPRLELTLTPTAAPSPVTPSVPVPVPEPDPEPVVPPEPEPVTPTEPEPEPEPVNPPGPVPAPGPGAEGGPLVFAHYFTPYPLSLDNKPAEGDYYARNYLLPSGENSKFAEWGGLLRDRPLSPGASGGDWEVANFVTEIEQAQSAGIDGWTLDLLSSSGRHWEAALQMMEAADQVGDFYVVPMVDATAGFSDGSPASVAALLSQLYAHDSAYREDDGEYLLSSFKAEGKPVSWWQQVIASLENEHGLPITFQALFLDASDANMRLYAPIADGFSNWGTRTEHGALTRPDYAARAAALDRTWMEPVAVQDIRYKDGRWAESSNTAGVRAQWERAITQGADYVQIVTWNDYSESTQVAPSMAHGTAFLDLMRYYISWYHRGSPPALASDEVVLTHRTQFVEARPSLVQNLMGDPTLGGTSTAARDTVEALVWLTAPATVEVTAGGVTTQFDAEAGVSAYTVPLQIGTVSVTIDRGGDEVAALVSPHEVVATPEAQDLQYWAASSW